MTTNGETRKVTDKILKKLKRKGIVCRIRAMSDSGSFYIHLFGNANGIRVSDHWENDGLNYKYNIRLDLVHYAEINGRLYFPIEELSRAINTVIREEKIKYLGVG